jgi:hypothetical protein
MSDLQKDYLPRLSEPISDLLADPFTKLTRKYQTALLVAATVTVLLSAGIVTIKKVDTFGAEIDITVQIATMLAFLITCYLSFVFYSSVSADWVIAEAKHWSPLASIDAMKIAAMKELEALDEQSNRAGIEMNQIEKSKDSKLEEIDKQLRKIREEEKILQSKDYTEIRTQLFALYERESELSKTKMAALRSSVDAAQITSDLSIRYIYLKINTNKVESMIAAFASLTRKRLRLEFLFPLIYATLTLIASIAITICQHFGIFAVHAAWMAVQ